MLFKYKGINSDGYVVWGTLHAEDSRAAIRKIKSEGKADVLVDIQKVFDSPTLNQLRTNVGEKAIKAENRRRDKLWEKELRRVQKVREEFEENHSEKNKEEASGIKAVVAKVQGALARSRNKESTVSLDEESLKRLENLFAEKAKSADALEDMGFDEKIEEYEKALQIEERVKNRLREKTGDKEINWDLIKEKDLSLGDKKNLKLKVKPTEIFLFTRRLQIMISSGVSLIKALMILEKSSSPVLAKVLSQIVERIQAGSSLSEALSRFPNQFNHAYVALVSVGESSGSLERCLKDVLAIQEQQMTVRKKVKSATVYPAVIGVVLIVVLIFGSVYFIPNFEEMFADQGMELPFLTRMVFGIAAYVPYILGAMAVAIGVIAYLKKRISALDRFIKKHWHKALLTLPVVKNVTNANYMYSFSSTVALMLGNGIRLKDTLGLAYRTIANVHIRNSITGASALMVRGQSFSEALGQQKHFDSILVNIVETGEESGRMTFSLEQISNYYKEDLERQIAVLMELVQPVSILLVALLIGPVIIAVYLPILDMSSGALGI